MITISHNVSHNMITLLADIDAKQRTLAGILLSRETERHLRWQTTVKRLRYIPVADEPLPKNAIEELLKRQQPLPFGDRRQIVLNYRNILTTVDDVWYVTKKPVTIATVLQFAKDLAVRGTKRAHTQSMPFEDVERLLKYIQSASDHPVVSAAVVYGQMAIFHSTPVVSPMGFLLAYTFLWRGGIDGRGFLSLESMIGDNKTDYINALESIRSGNTWNQWLLYFISTLSDQFDRIIQDTALHSFIDPPATNPTRLSTRERTILTLVANPGSTITNAQVQKHCRVSQITASRDLAHLTAIGLLSPRGKGRSTHYIKI